MFGESELDLVHRVLVWSKLIAAWTLQHSFWDLFPTKAGHWTVDVLCLNSNISTFSIMYIASLESLLKNVFFVQIVTDRLHL